MGLCSSPALPQPREFRAEPYSFAWGKQHVGQVAAVLSKHWLCSRYVELGGRHWQPSPCLRLPGASHDERSL